MTAVRTLLLALLLPVMTLPEGLIVCLHRLLGEAPARSCCTKSCCGNARDAAAPAGAVTLTIKKPDCTNCCVELPQTERSLNPTTKKLADPAPVLTDAPIVAPTHSICFEPPLASTLLARAVRLRPPPLVPISRPLRR